ncbi:hypothetical protein ACGFRB_02095 [Streptomyces sp. NPDC048718]|uniref:hypothetical protein n=1 Tax=Streptomyces sp. NPDC048718 TaxID=3365587 RepID=UPI00371FE7FE
MLRTSRARRGLVSSLAGLALAAGTVTGLGTLGTAAAHATTPPPAVGASEVPPSDAVPIPHRTAETALYAAMRQLWAQHVHWTYSTFEAFFHNPAALQPTANRLLQNQRDIGDALAPYYGRATADKLTDLLLTHVNDAVPVLQALKDGDAAALKKASDAWYANAKQIADALSAANPHHWPRPVMEAALKTHITQTGVYATDLSRADYTKAITDFDAAEEHMETVADLLSKGIVAQFPGRFTH